jgi:hypothetical protein
VSRGETVTIAGRSSARRQVNAFYQMATTPKKRTQSICKVSFFNPLVKGITRTSRHERKQVLISLFWHVEGGGGLPSGLRRSATHRFNVECPGHRQVSHWAVQHVVW